MTDQPDSPAHLRLNRIVDRCPGSTPALREGLRALDADTATALARLLELFHTEVSRSTSGSWVRGFVAGQQV